MRLLRRRSVGDFELVTFDSDDLPPYAILSHAWIEGGEVTYDELLAGTGKDKAGYAKIRFCGQRAVQDGLDYFWVDTCCINKSTSDEVSTAINSMFRWYQRANRCYVYLSDVQAPDETLDMPGSQKTWEDTFRRSRWFTRGWTLQELLAPATVEFFSESGQRLGSKASLEDVVHEITNIPIEALRGQRLSDFSVEERMAWAANRKTTIKEDRVYCLLGIFGVFLPLIYGEGEEYASLRLKEEVQKRQQGRQMDYSRAWPENYSSPFSPKGGPVVSPIQAAGASDAIAGIIGVITRSIETLRELQNQVFDVDCVVCCLTTQLTVLRAALAKIREWADAESVETHHQLIMDLGGVLSCCGMLMDRLNAEVAKIQEDPHARFNIKAKFKAAFSGKSVYDLQSMIEQQISALNLLITAYNCKTITEQRSLLEKSGSRRAFKKIDNDVASLYVHRDSDSFVSRLTDTLTKISREFVFDRLLWTSKVYKDASPSLLELMRERVRHQQFAKSDEPEVVRSRTIDGQLKKDFERTRSVETLVVGSDKSQVNSFINTMKMISECPERPYDAGDIGDVMKRAVTTLIDMSQVFASRKGLAVEDLPAELEFESLNQTSADGTNAIAQGLQRLWSSEIFKAAMREEQDYFPCWAECVVQHADRIVANDSVSSTLADQAAKIASDLDYVINDKKVTREARICIGLMPCHLTGIAIQDKIPKWIHQFDNAFMLIFMVDLCGYDKDPFEYGLHGCINLFDRLVNQPSLSRTQTILLLVNQKDFLLELSRKPLSNYFPDYSGGCDGDRAVQYIRERFDQCIPATRRKYFHVGEAYDSDLTISTCAAITDSVVEYSLRAVNII